jgi:hypothetical protein
MGAGTKRKPDFIAYMNRETKTGRRWIDIGAAWLHANGKGFTVQLTAMPLDGKVVCVLPSKKPDDGDLI